MRFLLQTPHPSMSMRFFSFCVALALKQPKEQRENKISKDIYIKMRQCIGPHPKVRSNVERYNINGLPMIGAKVLIDSTCTFLCFQNAFWRVSLRQIACSFRLVF